MPVFSLITIMVHADTVNIREWLVLWGGTRPRDPYVDIKGRVWFGTDTNFIGRARVDLAESQ